MSPGSARRTPTLTLAAAAVVLTLTACSSNTPAKPLIRMYNAGHGHQSTAEFTTSGP
ncbi:hypothetical protein [Streptacidiphilus sp. MAP5-3]|uniref:hypothetical protein n=1 Tax=unclassified Streptacidiphilus TaxID=2643834 RepID=UPI003514F259